jgi:hypothetical protein
MEKEKQLVAAMALEESKFEDYSECLFANKEQVALKIKNEGFYCTKCCEKHIGWGQHVQMFQCRSSCRQGVENARKMVLDRLLQKVKGWVMLVQ